MRAPGMPRARASHAARASAAALCGGVSRPSRNACTQTRVHAARGRRARPSRRSAARGCARRPATRGRARAASPPPARAAATAPVQHRVARELAGLDRVVDAREVLVDDAAGADVEMADLGVAHLSVGQADAMLGRVDRRVRARREELVASAACARARSRCRAWPRGSRSRRGSASDDGTHARAPGGSAAMGSACGTVGATALADGRVRYHFTFVARAAVAMSCRIRREELDSDPRARRVGRDARLAARAAPPVADEGRRHARGDAASSTRANAVLLDVREPKEFDGGQLPERGAHPAVAARQPQRRARQAARTRPVVAYCDDAATAAAAAGTALAQGGLHGHLPAARRLPRVEGRGAAACENDDATPTVTMYSTAICPYCIQAERFLHAQGRRRDRRRSASTSIPRGARR